MSVSIALAVLAQVRADPQVLADGEVAERATPFGHVGDAEGGDLVGPHAADVLAVEDDAAARADGAADRAEGRGLAGAVRAEDADRPAVRNAQRDAVQHLHRAVERGDVLELKQRHPRRPSRCRPRSRGGRTAPRRPCPP